VAKLIYTESYIKRAKKFAIAHPDIIPQYEKTLRLLEINPFHPSLGLHKLKGKLKKLYSVSINISYRICLDFIINEDKIILVDVGKHDYIY
jgi:proteic killer suppression protein